MSKNENRVEKCRACSIPGVLLGVSSLILTISLFVFGYSIIRSADILEAQNELKTVKKQYEEVVTGLRRLQDFSPEQYEEIGRRSYTEAQEALKLFKNVFIAAAMLTSQNGSHEDAITAWKQALHTNADSKICSYGLGMAYFKAGVAVGAEAKAAQGHLQESVKHLSAPSLLNNPQAQYHIALANLRLVDSNPNEKEKYKLAYHAIETLRRTDASKHPLGYVDRNIAYAYCVAGKYATDNQQKQLYKELAATYFSQIKDIPEFSEFYTKHFKSCVTMEKTAK